jgi:hypothetical protein
MAYRYSIMCIRMDFFNRSEGGGWFDARVLTIRHVAYSISIPLMRGGSCGGYYHCTRESIIHEKLPTINSKAKRGVIARALASLGYSRSPA